MTDQPKQGSGHAMAEAAADPPRQTDDVPVAEPTASDDPSAVSLMITRRQRAALRDLGLSDAMIREMTPQEAHRLLRL